MQPEALLEQLRHSLEYFNRSSACLQEGDSTFAPQEGMYTVAQQVAHVAHSVDWFTEGAFGENGFDLDFSKFATAIAEVTSLEAARQWLDEAYKQMADEIRSRTPEELAETLPEGLVMGGAPRFVAVSNVAEHTAHHRGALTVYARLLGRVPASPYMD